MKYKIEIIGRGVDCYVHKIDENQLRNLIDNEIESGMTSILEISDILSIDDSLDTELVHTGFYSDSGSYIIRVTCDDKVLDFEDYDFDDYEYSSIYRDDNYLIISDVIKGNIFNYDIEIDGEFDIEKLKPTILDICEDLDIIVDFTYNGESLIKEWGDYYSKGFDYYICEI
jgi:hypothetical protein